MKAPTVSVLMPVYNGCRLGVQVLKMAIDSILLQTFSDLEFVVVDDGSDDETVEVVSSYCDPRIKLIKQPSNTGIVGALNNGLSNCSGTFVARQDADDYSVVTRLAHQVEFMQSNPEIAVCGTRMWVVDKNGAILIEVKDRPLDDDRIRYFLKHTGCAFAHGSVMMRREALEEVGGYDPNEQYRHAEDYRLWVEFAAKGKKLAIIPHTLYYHRNHPHKVSATHSGAQIRATQRIIQLARKVIK